MTATQAAQEQIDTLRGKLNDFEMQLTTLHIGISEKRTAAGARMLEGLSTSKLEADISRLESRCKTIESAKATASSKLSEAIENLSTAKKTDAQERMKEIRKEVDDIAKDMEDHLIQSIEKAEGFEKLLNEAFSIFQNVKVPLSSLSSWVGAISKNNSQIPIDSILKEILNRIRQHTPKKDT